MRKYKCPICESEDLEVRVLFKGLAYCSIKDFNENKHTLYDIEELGNSETHEILSNKYPYTSPEKVGTIWCNKCAEVVGEVKKGKITIFELI